MAPFEESVPPTSYGGTELVVANLAEQLVQMGHEVTLIATGDSHTSAKLLPVFPHSLRADPKMLQFREKYKYIGTGKAIDILRAGSFDVIHNHLGWRLLPFVGTLSTPVVTTLHGQLCTEDQRVSFAPFAERSFVSISLSQRRGMPALHYVGNVYNGIEVERFSVGTGSRSYLAFLGRMSPEKGPVEAIRVARAAGIPIKLAAKVDAVDKVYFEQEVAPLLDNKTATFIGEVNHAQKVELLQHAVALLSPIQWEEPFGLVNVEAMACGTPVIALGRGSLPELIADGKTGYICKTVEEMTAKVAVVDRLDRAACRAAVEQRFSASAMARNYLAVYQQIPPGNPAR